MVSVTEAVRDFAEIVNQVRYQGLSIILTKGNKTVASLNPVATSSSISCAELSKFLKSHASLDEKDKKSFAAELKASRKNLRPESNPWPS